jgi:hypothetical protein
MLETKLILNGAEYTLAYDWEAQVKAEEMTGMNMLAPSATSAGFRALFLARLLKHHPDMTVEKASALIPLNTGMISTALHSIGENQDDVEEEVKEEVKEIRGDEVSEVVNAGD